jgi:hypothetical protein
MARSNYSARSRRHAVRCHQSGSKLADRLAGFMLISLLVAGMASLVGYANARDAEHFKANPVASFPSRPEECNGECPPMDDHMPIVFGM